MIKLYNCLGSAMAARVQNEGDEVIGLPPGVSETTRKSWLMNLLILIFLFGAATSWSQVSVTATAGTTGPSPYATVSAAFAAINAGTHQGAITIAIINNTTEPAAPVALLKSAAPSSYGSVLIQPSGGNWTINSFATPTASRGVIELNGADNVTIDGDDPATAGTRNLTVLVASNTLTGTAAIRLSSNSTTGLDGADNNTVKNCNIIGGRNSATATTTGYGIVMSNSTAIATGAYSSINTIIDNNLFTRCYHGIFANGESATYLNSGTRIRNNIFGSSVGADNIGFRAIFVDYSASTGGANSAIIENNDMRVGDVSASGAGYTSSIAGVELAAANAGAIVRNNSIHDVMNPNTGGYGAFGISVTSATSNDGISIYNNFIRDIVASRYSTTLPSSFENYGIYISAAATNLKINHNTIALLIPNTTGTVVQFASGCITISSSTATVSQMMNNILVNNNVSTNSWGIYTAGTVNLSAGAVNNNNYYTPGANIGYYSGSFRTTLSAWQTATSKDANSLNVAVPFSSPTDLHIPAGTATLLESAGAPAATTAIAIDYDGQARPGPAGSVNGGGLNPDMGADEFDGSIPTCASPSSIVASAVTNTTATISWSAASPVPSGGYFYEVRSSGGADSGPTGLAASGNTAALTANITGLTQGTLYTVYVRSFCGGTDYSPWSSGTFSTKAVIAVPWTEGFATTTLPPNWTSAFFVGNATGLAGNPGNTLYRNLYSSVITSVATTPNLGPITAGQVFTFDYRLANYDSPYAAPPAGSGNFVVAISTDYGVTFTNLETVANDGVSGWRSKTYSLSSYVGNNVSFRITGNWISGDYNLAFDNFAVVTPPSCVAPTGLMLSALTSDSATISWTASTSAPASGYDYFVSTSNTAPTGVTTPTGSVGAGVTSASLTALSATTTYYYWVRANCGAGDLSAWSNSGTFATPCASHNLSTPLAQNFDAGTTMPACWTRSAGWIIAATSTDIGATAPSPPNFIYRAYSNTAPEFLYSAPVDMTTAPAGATLRMKLYRNASGLAADGYTIMVNTLPSATGATTIATISSDSDAAPAAAGTGWFNYESTIPATFNSATAVYVIVRGITGGTFSSYDLGIDDFVILRTPTCYDPTALIVSNIAPTTVDLSWTAPTTGTSPIGYEYTVTTSATPPVSGTSVSGTSVTASGLTSGVTYYAHVRSECVAGSDYSIWVTSAPFTFIDGDSCAYAVDLSAQTSPISSTTVGLRNDYTPTCNSTSAGDIGPDKFYSIVVPANFTLVMGLTASSYDSVHTIFYGSCAVNTSIVCTDSETLQTTWTNTTGSSQTVYWVQDAWFTASGTFTLAWTLTPPPIVISSFTPTAVCSVDLATTIVTLTGSNFINTTSVTLGGVETPFTVVNDTTIEVALTASSTGGTFTVTNADTYATSAESLTITTSPTVAPITGPSFVCLPNTNTITLSSATPTGIWSSSDVDVATVSASGVVTPVTEGDVTISYTVSDTGCSTTQTYAVSVNEPVVISSSTATQTIVTDGDTFFTAVASGTPSGDLSQLTYQWEIYTDPDPEVQDDEFFTPLTDGPVYGGTDTATLTLTNVPASLNETLYHVVITGACNVAISDLAVLIVGETGIDEQPENATVCEGTNSVSFTVDASEDVTAYQWEEDQGGDNWLPITDGGVYSGATTESLTLTGFNGTFSGYKYRVSVTGIGSATSNAALLTIVPTANITTDPTDQAICYTGGSASFTTAATNVVSYAWEYSADGGASWNGVANGVPTGATYTGISTTTLNVTTTAATPAAGTYSYRAVANSANGCPGDFSNPANLLINTPAITSQPTATSVVAGNTATFTVATSAPSPTYQWQYATVVGGPYSNVANAAPAGVTYSGADTATLSVIVSNTAVASTARFYRAIVSSPVGCSVTSNPAQLTITTYCASNATSTSDLDIAQVIFGSLTNPATPPSPLSNNATATATYTDFTGLAPQNFTQGTTYPIVVKQVNRTTTYYISWTKIFFDWNKDGDFSDVGEAFNGADGPATFPADGIVYSSNITVPLSALPGTTRMRVVLDESGTASTTPLGCGTYTWGETEDYTINILPAPACDGAPVAGTATSSTQNICVSGTATLSVSGYSEGVTGITFQWYDSAGLISGATGTSHITPVLNASNTYYVQVTCTNSGQSTNSNSVTVNVNNPSLASTNGGGRCGTGTVQLTATGSAGTAINWYAAATGGSSLFTGTNFTTPTISNTTTYYAEASIGGTGQSYGRLAPATGDTGSTIANWGIVFDVNTPTTLQSVDLYATTGGTVNIKIMNAAMTTELFSTGNVTVTAGGVTTPNVIPLNFSLPAGTGYRILVKSFTGAVLVRSSVGNAFPYNGPELNVTASEWGGTTTGTYYYFYNLRSAGCTSARTAVTATVTTAPALTLSSSATAICEGASTTPPVQILAGSADYDTFTWSPATGVSGTSGSGYTFNPTTTTVYTLTASQTGGSQCQNTATFTVTVNPLPAPVTITPDNATVCSSDTTALLLTANGGNAPASIVSGTGTTTTVPNTTASTLGPNPLQDFYGGSKQQWIYTASELTALGFTAGSTITSFSLDMTTVDGTLLNGLVIKMKNSTKTSFSSTTNWETGMTTVRPAASYTPVVGLNNFALSTPFVWNGTGSLIIEMNYSNSNTGAATPTNSAKYSATSFVSTIFYRVDNATAAVVDAFTGTASFTYSFRNNVVFQLNNPTSITWTSNVANSLFTDAAGTVPYTGTASATVYAKPTTSAVITATATSSAGCFVTDTTNVNVSTATTWYADADGDGYGSATAPSVMACSQPPNTSASNTDCNDAIASINPGAAEVPFDGVDNNCNNQLDEGNQLTTQLLPEVCNTTLTSIGSLIGITTVNSSITGYRIRVTNGAQVQIIERDVPHFTLPMLPSYQYATTYTVEIELKRNGVWIGYYGPSCTVSSPPVLDADGSTQVSPSQCGITLARINTLIATTSLQGVTGYRFRVTNITPGASGPNVIQSIDRANHWFSLPMLTQYNYGSTYRIEVAIKTNGTYSGFGAPCEVSSPAAPTLINCGGVVASASTLIAATSLQGVTQYRFQVVRMSDGATTTIDRNNNYFTFAMVPGYTQAAQYGVRVSVMTAGTWSPFGDACEITSPGAGTRFTPATTPMDVLGFKAVAYPNPFASTFNIDVTSSIAEQVQIRVYDMTGKLIETREANASDLNTLNVGDRYPAGVYNVIVTQGVNVKTLRVIKR